MDLRGREFFDHLFKALDDLAESSWVTPQILFLDADDATLVRRYKETRRKHPLAPSWFAVRRNQHERDLLKELKGRAQLIYNTSKMKPRELREKILTEFSLIKKPYLLSMSCLLVLNMEFQLMQILFLMCAFYRILIISIICGQRQGLNEEVSGYVLKWTETQKFIEKVTDLLTFMLPHYKREGKSPAGDCNWLYRWPASFGCTCRTIGHYFREGLPDSNFAS